jgi:hypothetical protein
MAAEILHTYSDGSQLMRMSIRQILATPTWQGNRILDAKHVLEIQESLRSKGKNITHLDSGYHIIKFKEIDAAGNEIEQSYLIDGQHRKAVIEADIQLFEDFTVTCCVLKVDSEFDAIQKFNEINSSKPIQFKEDITQIANRFIESLVKMYGNKKLNFIRNGKTTRPYCSVDDIRKTLLANEYALRRCLSPEYFIKNVEKWNRQRLLEIELEFTQNDNGRIKDANIKERAQKMGWVLGVDQGFIWIRQCLGRDTNASSFGSK